MPEDFGKVPHIQVFAAVTKNEMLLFALIKVFNTLHIPGYDKHHSFARLKYLISPTNYEQDYAHWYILCSENPKSLYMTGFNELIRSGKTVLVDFSAEWCGPCKMMAPILKQTKDALGDKATIVKIDIDRNRPTAEHFQIQGVPTLILFKNGEIKWRQSGVVPANTLIQVIKQYAEN